MGISSLSVLSPLGKRASPYRVEGRVLVKRVKERHIYRAKQAVGVDESVWERVKNRVKLVRFEFDDGRAYEISNDEFTQKSFLHGDNVIFAVTRFVRLADLRIVREKRENPRQLGLFAVR